MSIRRVFAREELDKLQGGQHGLILDSNDLELATRGITILSKKSSPCTSPAPRAESPLIDDALGPRADFLEGRAVDRGRQDMADEVALLLVDAAERLLCCRRGSTGSARRSSRAQKPIVVINKIDRPDARPVEVHVAVFDLFVELEATEDQLDFVTVYAAGKKGISTNDLSVPPVDLKPLFDAILKSVPPPEVELDAPLQMLVTTLQWSDYVGRIGVGRIVAGKIKKNQRIALLKHDGRRIDMPVKMLYTFDRLGRTETDEVSAGDLCAVVGVESVDIGDTIADIDNPVALPAIKIDEPTLNMIFRINDSPFVGQEGTYVTSRQLRDRLMKELESNVALRVVPREDKRDEFEVSGRGLLHLSILMETMRREGFELSVGKPRVINKEIDGVLDGADRVSRRRGAEQPRRSW